MSTDVILTEREVSVSGGTLNVDQGFKAGNSFAANRPHLNFDLNGLVISDDTQKTRITPDWVLAKKGIFTNIGVTDLVSTTINVGKGNPSEPGKHGVLKLEDGLGKENITLNGKDGKIVCNDIQVDSLGSLVQIIKQLQNEILILKRNR